VACTAKTAKNAPRFVLFAILCTLASFFPSLVTAQQSTSAISGTTWVTKKAGSIIVFVPDGTWTETWKKKKFEGTWQPNADNTEIVVTRSDGTIFHFKLNAGGNLVRDPGKVVYHQKGANDVTPEVVTSAPEPEHNAPTVKLTEDQARAVVLIKGDNAEGTGFLVKMPNGPVVMTNIHVISNNPNLKITTNTGEAISILSYKGATDRDLAMIAIKDGDYKYLDLATDVSGTVQPGDEVVTPGNSEGGEVMLNTGGKVLGIGPDRIEFDNPIYHGNSGGPVFHVKSGKVIGIVTEAMKVDTSDALDKASFANRASAIGRSMRYFGFRLDNVPGWEVYDLRRFLNETAFLDQFDLRSRCLDCYINAPDDNKPEDTLWQQDDKIVKANSGYFDQANGADTEQKLDAARVMWSSISDVARTDMDAIQDPSNFYSFDQQRAKDEAAYRKLIKAELDQINNSVTQLGSLPRTNN
jgi:hypothetical protein